MLLGILFLFFIGKYFYNLANQYNKSPLGYAILGIVSYYFGTILFMVFLGLGMEIFNSESIDFENNKLLSLISIPFGLLSCYLLYIFLKKTWSKNLLSEDEINKIIDEIGED